MLSLPETWKAEKSCDLEEIEGEKLQMQATCEKGTRLQEEQNYRRKRCRWRPLRKSEFPA